MLLCFAFFGVVRAEVVEIGNSNIAPSASSTSNGTTTAKNQLRILQNAAINCLRPTGLNAGTPDAHSVELSWIENGAATEWVISYNENTINADSNPFTLTDLTPETTYYVRVKAICGPENESEYSDGVNFTTTAACPAPTNLTATQVTATSATLNWEGFGESYNVSYTTVARNVIGSIALDDIDIEGPARIQWVNLTGVSDNSIEITGLEPETGYMWKVQADCGAEDGTSLWSSSTFTTLDACATPSNLEVTDFTATSATLNWTGAQDSYNVQYRTAARAGEWVVVENANTAFNLTPLEPETEYEWQVQGVDCDGEGTDTEWSEIATFTTLSAPESEIVTIGDGGTTNNTYLPGFNYYNYSLTQQIYTPCEIGMAGTINSIAFKNTGAEKTRTYNVYMLLTDKETFESDTDWVAMSDNDLVFAGEITFAVDEWTTITLDTPFDLDGVNNLLVGVADVTGGYSGSPYMACLVFDATSQAIRSCRDSGAYDIANPGSGTVENVKNQIQLNITPDPSVVLCCPPTNLTTDQITAHEALLMWEGDADEYTVEYKKATDEEWTEFNVADTLTLLENLTQNTIYNVRVKTYCGEESSSSPITADFTTLVACPAPTNLIVAETDITAHGATATWNGTSNSYVVMIGEAVLSLNTVDFEDQTIPLNWTNDASYPWVITSAAAAGGTYSMKSGNTNVHNSTSSIQITATYTENTTLEFDVRCSSEQNSQSYDYDYGTFYIDAVQQGDRIINSTTFTHCSYEVEAGTHTFMWKYKKDNSVSSYDDCLYVDNIVNVPVATVNTWTEYTTTEQTYTFDNLTPETDYQVKVKGNCGDDGYSEETAPVRFTTLESCVTPFNFTVNYTGGLTAEVTWEGEAETYNIDVNGEVTEGVTSPYILDSLELATTYAVKVQANCGNDLSNWTSPVSFLTDLCLLENQCEITIELTDSYGDGWNGGQMQVVDVLTEKVLGTYTLTSGSSGTFTLAVCDGRDINFVYTGYSYPSENGWVITDVNGEVISEHEGCSSGCAPTNGIQATYTVNCAVDHCKTPYSLDASEIGVFSANLRWNGNNEDYNLRYRHPVADTTVTTATIILEADNVWNDGSGYQMLLDADATAYGTLWNAYHYILVDGEQYSGGDLPASYYDEFEYKIPTEADGALSTTNVVVTGSVTITIPAGTYDYAIFNPSPDYSQFYIAADNGEVGGAEDDFVFEAGVTYHFTMQKFGDEDGAVLEITPLSEWILEENVTSPYNFTGLTSGEYYEWQVQGISTECDGGVTEWSEIASFFTPSFTGKRFVGGDADDPTSWNVAANWDPVGIPIETDDVLITVPVEIPNECVAVADEAYLNADATITIKDGGQLKYHRNGLIVTMEKNIAGYDESHTNNNSNNGGYYLLANPVIDDQAIADITGMTQGSYDLYYFDQNSYDNEWINQKDQNNQFTHLQHKVGYLYANANDKVLSFTGEVNGTLGGILVPLVYNSDARYAGVNLIGNPFTCDAYLEEGGNRKDFYKIYEDLDPAEFVVSSDPVIKPMEGVLVIAESEEEDAVMFSIDPIIEPGDGKSIDMHLNNREGHSIDLARIRFGQGSGLRKFQLNPSHTKVFIPQDGTDFAVAFTDSDSGEMPVCFKAQSNGRYTLNVTTKGLELSYLHLIDNAANKDIDLLNTPSYSFEANSTDNADRFRLVFVCGEATGDNFAFFSNGSFVINNEGEAVLQVIDVMGRVVKSETINGCASIGMNTASGVYMLRLVNGDNVKVQKVVVR